MSGRCDQEVFDKGECFAVVTGSTKVLEALIEKIREHKGCEKTDWHFVGGRGRFLTLGDVKTAQEALKYEFPTFYTP